MKEKYQAHRKLIMWFRTNLNIGGGNKNASAHGDGHGKGGAHAHAGSHGHSDPGCGCQHYTQHPDYDSTIYDPVGTAMKYLLSK